MSRVCHVQLLPVLAGVQRVMLDLFGQLDRTRYELHVVCRQRGPLTEELDRRGIACHLLPRLDRPIRPRRDLLACQDLESLFRRERFDLVHTHSSKPGILGRLAARRAGVPRVVHHVHGFSFHAFSPFWQRRLFQAAERRAAAWCDRLVFVNHQERLEAVRCGVAPAEKCLTIHNGVDLRHWERPADSPLRAPLRRRLGLAENEVLIATVGRLDIQKQPLIVPRIAERLAGRPTRRPWRIVVAGEGTLQAALERQVGRRRLAGRVNLVGWQSDPRCVYHAADVVLHPSLWEGLPLTLLEAHAAGLPSVAADVCGNREAIVEGAGLLCPPKDAEAFASALARLIDDAALCAAMGAAARRRAEQAFDARRNYRLIALLYDSLLDPAATRRAA